MMCNPGEKKQCCWFGIDWREGDQGEEGFPQPRRYQRYGHQHLQWSHTETWHLHQQRQSRLAICRGRTSGECPQCPDDLWGFLSSTANVRMCAQNIDWRPDRGGERCGLHQRGPQRGKRRKNALQ